MFCDMSVAGLEVRPFVFAVGSASFLVVCSSTETSTSILAVDSVVSSPAISVRARAGAGARASAWARASAAALLEFSVTLLMAEKHFCRRKKLIL